MARIRSVHPGLATDEDMLECKPLVRLFFILLGTQADDYGCFEWKPVRLKVRLLPNDKDDVEPILAELERVNRVAAYTVAGKKYGVIRNFLKFQRPQKPMAYCPRDGVTILVDGKIIDINVYNGLIKSSTGLDTPADPVIPVLTPPADTPSPIKDANASAEGRKGDKKEEDSIGSNEPLNLQGAAVESGVEGNTSARPAEAQDWVRIGEWVLEAAGLANAPRPMPVVIVKEWLSNGWTEGQIKAGVTTATSRSTFKPPRSLKFFEDAIREASAQPAADAMAYARSYTADFDESRWRRALFQWAHGEAWSAALYGPAPNQPGTLVWPMLLDVYTTKFGSLEPNLATEPQGAS